MTTVSSCYSTSTPLSLEWFGSLLVAVPFAVGAIALPIVWYIVGLIYVDINTMYYHYAFVPMGTGMYTGWSIAMFIIVPFLCVGVSSALCKARDTGRVQWILYSGAAAFAILLVVGHVLGAIQTTARQDAKTVFATKFNDVYCSARTFKACIQGNEHDILTLVGRNPATAATASNATPVLLKDETVSTVAFSIWKLCVDTRAETTKRVLSTRTEDEGYTNAPVYQLLDDCESSRDVDVWCGHYRLQNTTLSTDEHLALPSPFASNPHMFAKYTGEWARRLKYADVFLGTTIGCIVLLALSLRVRYE